MNKLIAILYLLYAICYVTGCAYKGDVYLYSPQGQGISVEKAISTDAEISIPLIP